MFSSRSPWGGKKASMYHPNSPDAFLATPFVQPRSFHMTIPISSSANSSAVSISNQVTVPISDSTNVHEKVNYSETSTKAEAETITKGTINSYDGNVFFESSSRTIKEQCTFPKQTKDAIIMAAVGLTTAAEINRAVNLDENPMLGMTNIILSGLKTQALIEEREERCTQRLENEGASTNILLSSPKSGI